MTNVTVSEDIDEFLRQADKRKARGKLNTWLITSLSQTAIAGDKLQIDTTDDEVTITLPDSPTAGDEILAEDAALSWGDNNVTFDRNGEKINSVEDDYVADGTLRRLSIVYINSTIGWSIK